MVNHVPIAWYNMLMELSSKKDWEKETAIRSMRDWVTLKFEVRKTAMTTGSKRGRHEVETQALQSARKRRVEGEDTEEDDTEEEEEDTEEEDVHQSVEGSSDDGDTVEDQDDGEEHDPKRLKATKLSVRMKVSVEEDSGRKTTGHLKTSVSMHGTKNDGRSAAKKHKKTVTKKSMVLSTK